MVNRNWFGSALVLAAVAVVGAASTLRARALTAPTALASPAGVAPRPGGSFRFTASAAALGPEAQRLEVRRQLYESVDAFVEAGEFERARQLLDYDAEIYGAEVAPEWRDLGQSYRLIADCLEHPSAQLRTHAASFVTASHAVSLASRVLSACTTAGAKHRRQGERQHAPL